MAKPHPTIIIDSREQKPYVFRDAQGAYYDTIIKALPAGDYSIEGYECEIAVERKSLDDLVNTVIHSKERFHRELTKLRMYGYAIIVVEATVGEILAHNYSSQASPKAVLASALSKHSTFGIPVMFWDTRQIANELTRIWLELVWAQVERQKQKVELLGK